MAIARYGNDLAMGRRILDSKARSSGYIKLSKFGNFELTDKGWRTLCAAAQTPIKKPKAKAI